MVQVLEAWFVKVECESGGMYGCQMKEVNERIPNFRPLYRLGNPLIGVCWTDNSGRPASGNYKYISSGLVGKIEGMGGMACSLLTVQIHGVVDTR